MKARWSCALNISGAIIIIALACSGALAQTIEQARAFTRDLGNTVTSWTEFDTRVSSVTTMIESSHITDSDKAELRIDLSRLVHNAKQERAAAKHIPLSNALSLTAGLNRIIARCKHDHLADGKDIRTQISELNSQIDASLNGLYLTQADAGRLKAQINNLNASVAAGTSGGHLQTAVNDLRARFAQLIKLSQTVIADLNRREVDLEMSINDAVDSNRLGLEDSRQFREKLDRITSQQSAFIASNTDGPLSSVQIQALAGEIDRLNTALNRALVKPGAH